MKFPKLLIISSMISIAFLSQPGISAEKSNQQAQQVKSLEALTSVLEVIAETDFVQSLWNDLKATAYKVQLSFAISSVPTLKDIEANKIKERSFLNFIYKHNLKAIGLGEDKEICKNLMLSKDDCNKISQYYFKFSIGEDKKEILCPVEVSIKMTELKGFEIPAVNVKTLCNLKMYPETKDLSELYPLKK